MDFQMLKSIDLERGYLKSSGKKYAESSSTNEDIKVQLLLELHRSFPHYCWSWAYWLLFHSLQPRQFELDCGILHWTSESSSSSAILMLILSDHFRDVTPLWHSPPVYSSCCNHKVDHVVPPEFNHPSFQGTFMTALQYNISMPSIMSELSQTLWHSLEPLEVNWN